MILDITKEERSMLLDVFTKVEEDNDPTALAFRDKVEALTHHQPVLREDGNLHTYMLSVDGKPYRCPCGGNVFHKPNDKDLNLYQCNSCRTQIREIVDGVVT